MATVSPKIFYFCHDHQNPRGGQKHAYKHVDILRRNGYDAYALHFKKGFRLTWFTNKTRVICWQEFKKRFRTAHDFIVLPEDLQRKILAFPGKKIIFNRNVYFGYHDLGVAGVDILPYLDPQLRAVMTVSTHNQRLLQCSFPRLCIRRVYNSVDPELFRFTPPSQKKRLIVVCPVKSFKETVLMQQALIGRARQGRNVLASYRWAYLHGFNESELVGVLREALILLFLSRYEGLPMLPLEAMSSGTVVASYDAGPAREYLRKSNSLLAPAFDEKTLIYGIERAARLFEAHDPRLQRLVLAASKTAAAYSPRRQEQSVLRFWQEMCAR